MGVGDKYKCNDCGKIYKAKCTLYTKECNSINCMSKNVVLYAKLDRYSDLKNAYIPVENKPKIEQPVSDYSEVPSLVFRPVDDKSDDVLDEAIERIDEKKEEKRMAKEDKEEKEGWASTGTPDYDPQTDFKKMLRDLGLKNKIETIASMFFSGDIDKPQHLDNCLKLAGIDKARRRLAVASHFGHIPDDLEEDDDYEEETKSSKKSKKAKDDDDPIKEVQDEMKQNKARKLRELAADMEIRDLEVKLQKEADKDKPNSPNNDIVRIPATDDNGNIVKDEKQVPVILELHKGDLPMYFLSRNAGKGKEPTDTLAQQLVIKQQEQITNLQNMFLNKAAEGNKPDERALAEKKYWEERAERERKERDEMMKGFQKERDDMMTMVHEMRETFLKKELEDMKHTVMALNKPLEDQLKELQGKAILAQNMGLIATGADPKTQVQTEIARGIGEEGKALVKEVRDAMKTGVQEGLSMVKEERAKQRGGAPNPPVEIGITKEDKEAMYAKIQAKMEDERRLMEEERQRITNARADFERRAAEFESKWKSASDQLNAPKAETPPEPPKLEPNPEPKQVPPRSQEEIAKEVGLVPEEMPRQSPVEIQSSTEGTIPQSPGDNPPLDAIDKKLKELENKGSE
jgi:hypothetical protein